MSKLVEILKDVYPFGCKGDIVTLAEEEYAKLEKVAEEAKDKLFKLHGSANAAKTSAADATTNLVAEAKAEAAKVAAEAQAAAEEVLAKANAEAEQLKADAQKEVDAAAKAADTAKADAKTSAADVKSAK